MKWLLHRQQIPEGTIVSCLMFFLLLNVSESRLARHHFNLSLQEQKKYKAQRCSILKMISPAITTDLQTAKITLEEKAVSELKLSGITT